MRADTPDGAESRTPESLGDVHLSGRDGVAMLDSLRTRLIVSHALPILLLLPLISFVLVYLLETRYFMVNLASEMEIEAVLIGDILEANSAVWGDQTIAAQRVRQLQEQLPHRLPARIMLLDGEGNILASSLAEDIERIGQPVESNVERRALAGDVAWDIQYSAGLGERVVDVAVPVTDTRGHVVGVVRLSHSVAQIAERLNPLRWFVLGTFAAGVAVAVALSFVLAGSLSSSILQLTRSVEMFSVDSPPQSLPVSGSREMRTLITGYNDMAQRLFDSEMARRQLLAGIVHEVGRPLGGINAAAQLLSRRERPEPELVHELATDIEAEAQDIVQQIDDLALLAQSDRGTLTLQREEIRLEELFSERCYRAVARIRKDGLEFEATFAPDLPPVYVDPSRVAQVLCNLLDNARKYTNPGGLVTVDARLEEDAEGAHTIAMRVADSGPGIPFEEQDKIFQYFYRIPQEDQVTEGMGIGLPLARQLAQVHGGTLEVESVPGQGATFVLRIPVQ